MKKIILLVVFYSLLSTINAQNLVPNGDFETYSSCPNGPAQTNLATPWYDPTGATSDYFNACANQSMVGVPAQGIYLFQPSRSGEGYAGFYALQPFGTNYREYLQIKLTDSLKNNNCYRVCFYINLANYSRYATNNVGAYLSTNAITVSSPNPYNINPHILSLGNPVINDTINWIKIEGNYQANGGENYLTIGNFYNDTNSIYQIEDTTNFSSSSAYYYIDDVSVINCNDTLSSVTEIVNQYDFKLYPNPNNGQMVLEYTIEKNEEAVLNIYDIAGKLISTYLINSNNKSIGINENSLDGGIYYYSISVNGKSVKSDKLVIIK